jgi:hypothetical protein
MEPKEAAAAIIQAMNKTTDPGTLRHLSKHAKNAKRRENLSAFAVNSDAAIARSSLESSPNVSRFRATSPSLACTGSHKPVRRKAFVCSYRTLAGSQPVTVQFLEADVAAGAPTALRKCVSTLHGLFRQMDHALRVDLLDRPDVIALSRESGALRCLLSPTSVGRILNGILDRSIEHEGSLVLLLTPC